MAEIVGFAASIAGLVAITGQIGKSILFIKDFLEDTENAPENVRSLAAEFELLGSAAKKTDALLVKCHADGINIDLEEERKGLVRYADMIERLKIKIEKDVKNFGTEKGHWWQRVRTAARKKSVEGYLVGVERAKTLVLGIETKIVVQLQQGHRDTLNTTNRSLETLQGSSDRVKTTLNKVETQTTHISSWTETAGQTLTTLSTEVQQINSKFNTLIPVMKNLQNHSNSQPELSALEAMLESAVMRGMKRHNEELRQSQPTSINHTPISDQFRDCVGKSDENTSMPAYSESFATLRRDKTVFQTSFRTPFFDIEIRTKEVQRIPRSKKGASFDELSRLKLIRSQRFTTYNVRVKIPFWRGGMTFSSGNSSMIYGGSLCKPFRAYNFVPRDAPIFRACRNLDLLEVQRLFEADLASPLDYNYDLEQGLIDTVLWEFLHFEHAQLQSAIDLLRFLVNCLHGDIGEVRRLHILFHMFTQETKPVETLAAFAEANRIIFAHTSEDPTDSLRNFLTIQLSKTPVYEVLTTQDSWWLDFEREIEHEENGIYEETDLQILKDRDGTRLEVALAKGFKYMPGHFGYDGLDESPLHSLLALASITMEEEFHECVQSRLVILLKSGFNPRSISMLEKFPFTRMGTIISTDKPMSCTEYAQLLGLGSLWADSLERAGWTAAEIDNLFEEDLVLATIALMDGEIVYQSRDDNRKEFIQALRQGKFKDLEGIAIEEYSHRAEFEIGLSDYNISGMIREVNSIFKERKTPGSWVEEQDINLVPGRDFELPYDYRGDQLKDWRCIREIWENGLGCCVPEGYAGNKYDYNSR